jgi:adhesin transport system membrane fusion protein
MLDKLSAIKNKHQQFSHDKDFMTDVHTVSLHGASIGSHLILWLSLIFVVVAIIWADLATLDEVTRGSGKIIPSSQIQVIQNLEGGILAEILVKEGDIVEQDQPLLRLSDIRFSSSFKETQLKFYELLANTARLTAEVEAKPLNLPAEVIEKHPSIAYNTERLFLSEKHQLETNLNILEQQVKQRKQELVELKSKRSRLSRSYQLLKKELQMSEPLVQEGAMSEVELLRLRRSTNDLHGELNSAQLALPRVQAKIDEVKNKIEDQKTRFHTNALEQLNESKAELDRVSHTILALQDRVTRTKVTSPVKGTIKQLKVSTIGGVIQPGMDLLEIVPIEDQLLIEAEIRPANIAFLRPGLKAMVKLTAYDFSIYGGLKAKLEHISADTITDEENGNSYFLIRLRTDKNYLEKNGEKLNIIAGMTVDVDILTGKKTVLDYLLKPIIKTRDRAFKER